MATEIITSFDQQCDASGDPMSGAKVYVYDVGTTTLKTVYSDTALSVSVANPIVCDSAGRHDMRYIATGSYKIVVKTSADVTVYTRDNIDGRVPVGSGALAIANGGTGATTAGAALTALGGATTAELADVAADVAALSGTLASTEKTHVATGTTAQRPASPAEGDIRRNTTDSVWEFYNGSAYQNVVVMPTGQTDPSATDSAEGLIEIAIQSEMETGTDVVRAVTPGRQHYHKGHVKMWGFAIGAGSPTLTGGDSYNVTSIADTAQGRLTITIATDFSAAVYAFLCGVGYTDPTILRAAKYDSDLIAAGTIEMNVNDDGSSVDPTHWTWLALGDQA